MRGRNGVRWRWGALVVALLWGAGSLSRLQAQGMATIDITNFGQNLITALENVDQTLTQLDQYRSQLEQQAESLRNAAAPAVYAWDKVDSISTKIRLMVDFEKQLRETAAKMKRDTEKLGDPNYYRSSPCYNGNLRCSQEEWKRMREQQKASDEALAALVNETSSQLLILSKAEGRSLQDDAENLGTLQRNAEAAGNEGYMASLQAANQLANAQAKQLLEIRKLLVQQAQQLAILQKAEQERQAREKAEHERLWRKPEERRQKYKANRRWKWN